MLAAPIYARASLPSSSSTFKGAPLRPSLAQKQTLRSRPIVVQGGFFEDVKNFFRAPKQKVVTFTFPAPPPRPFFNRFEEQKHFKNNVVNDFCCGIDVLLGPPNCGKSRFLKKLQDDFEAEENARLVLYIDGRSPNGWMTTPEQMSKSLRRHVMSEHFQKAIKKAFSSVPARDQVSMGLASNVSLKGGLVNFKGDEGDLTETLIGLNTLFEASKFLTKKPVLIFDEANELMDWKESDPRNPQLDTLFRFLILISKQRNLVHVISASADYFLVSWLNANGLSYSRFTTSVLGELPENEAREFLFGDAERTWPGIADNSQSETLPVPACSEDEWRKIYEHCGGNIWLLRQCVTHASGDENWDSALWGIMADAVHAVDNAAGPDTLVVLNSNTPPLWNGAQWKKVLDLIVNAPHHAVSKSKVEKELDKDSNGRGYLILRSMVEYNLLSLRYPSRLARDLPQEVYYRDSGVQETVVTLLLPSYLCAAKKLIQNKSFLEACERP